MAVNAPNPFELSAGHPALDFVNTLDDRFFDTGPNELLTSYDDLLRFATQSGLLTEKQSRKLRRLDVSPTARTQVLQEARELREAISAVVYSRIDGAPVPEASLVVLESQFKEAASHRSLTAEDGGFAWDWRGLGRQPAAPVWLLAEAAADLLVSGQVAALRACSDSACRWLFLDTSKNHTRRWCNMRVCGNRMKARRFQARQSA